MTNYTNNSFIINFCTFFQISRVWEPNQKRLTPLVYLSAPFLHYLTKLSDFKLVAVLYVALSWFCQHIKTRDYFKLLSYCCVKINDVFKNLGAKSSECRGTELEVIPRPVIKTYVTCSAEGVRLPFFTTTSQPNRWDFAFLTPNLDPKPTL